MRNDKSVFFDPFRLDLANQRLWQGAQIINLRPKIFAVLEYLVSRPNQLVTKEELLSAVWPETFVGEAVLKVAIRQIREALGDDSKSPRFIETAHRRGYRFIGPLGDRNRNIPNGPEIMNDIAATPFVSSGVALSEEVVGRDEALSRMRDWLERMRAGKRQIVFVTGEAGIGKTAFVDTFARRVIAHRNIQICRGQCLEQYGTSEAYLPVLEAIGRLGRGDSRIVDVLRTHAPMWLLQMPWLVSPSDRELLNREVVGATRERMLREMADALEAMTAEVPLVLILEDLHWSDYSTLDLISYLARHREATRLMVIGTYRTAELIMSGHPLQAVKRELLAKQQCEELPLEYLSVETVGTYLSIRFSRNRFPAALAELIHKRTEGNALFMVNAVDYLLTERLIREGATGWELVEAINKVEVGVPDSIKQLIEKQLDHLDEDQRSTLEAASVAGAEFTTVAVAAVLDEDLVLVEARCDELARQRQFIQFSRMQELPGRDAASRYGFIHALYQNVLYDAISTARRVYLHRRFGEQAAALYGDRAAEIAAELAMHFERGANHKKAIKYLHQTAENDIRRFAYKEAVALSHHALELLRLLPDTRERAAQELRLHITLGMPLIATEGYAAADVGSTYLRARELCRQLGETQEISEVLWGIWSFYLVGAKLATARQTAEEFLRQNEDLPYAAVTMQITLMHLGELTPAMEYFEKALSLYDPARHRDVAFRYSQNPSVATQCHAAWNLWLLGQPDQALDRIREALAHARELSEPHGLAHALFFAAIVHQLRREQGLAQEYAEAVTAISLDHGLALYQAMAMITRGWALVGRQQPEQAIEQIRQGLDAFKATGTELLRPHFLALLVEALYKTGRTEEGLDVLQEALATVQANDERYYEAELFRLKGELLLMRSASGVISQPNAVGATTGLDSVPAEINEAEHCFNRSFTIAQRQNAKSLELRAVTSLAVLFQNHGRREEARVLLTRTYNSFTQGFDTIDLREAKALLDELSSSTVKEPEFQDAPTLRRFSQSQR